MYTIEVFIAIALALVIYIIIFCIDLSINTTDYDVGPVSWSDEWECTSRDRDATTKDVWRSFIWPLRFIRMIFFGALDCLNSLIQYPLLFIGIKYKGTKMDWKIRNFLEGKY